MEPLIESNNTTRKSCDKLSRGWYTFPSATSLLLTIWFSINLGMIGNTDSCKEVAIPLQFCNQDKCITALACSIVGFVGIQVLAILFCCGGTSSPSNEPNEEPQLEHDEENQFSNKPH